ncbi:MAG: TonB-dependent receptor [Bacteroidota bacterium]|nr:TonB-dependent receptor [Bacteroidota bacterium]
MKKNNWIIWRVKSSQRRKIFLITKLLAVFILGFVVQSFADVSQAQEKRLNLTEQQKNISGKVTDSSGVALPGVSVSVKGTATGSVTDANGKYSISNVPDNATLVFSFIGMETQEIRIGTLTQINVTMVESTIGLEDVVVVGYGTIKKSDLTGSVSSIKPAELLHMPTQRVDQALQGRTAGVFIMNTDGSPGGNTIIRIRGLNSISGGSEPLIIIDGLQGGNINSVNPNDIASLEILKDASATAIYGSRGSNGVILITTKLGVKGKPVIEAGYNTGFSQISNKLPAMNAADFAKTANKWRMLQTGAGNVPTPLFTDAEIANWEKNGGTDWQDEVYQTGVLQNANLAVSGATDKLKYMVSLGYVDQKGIVTNTTYNRISLRANLTADVTNWMDFGLNYGYSRESGNGSSFKYSKSGYLGQLGITSQTWAPTVPVYDENGNYSVHPPGYGGAGSGNPVAWAMEPITDNPTYSSNANLFLNFKIIEGLSLKVIGGAQFTNDYYREYFNTKTIYGKPVNGSGRILESVFERYQNTNILTYDNTFGLHHLTFTGVLEQINEEGKGSSMNGTNFLVDQLNFDNMSGAKSVTISSNHNERSLLSYMGRINYGLNDKYLATFSYRADGSSVFGADNKWGYFPSGSLAWKISQEDFLKNSTLVSDLKLRGSYGLTGNQGINPYQSFAKLGSSPAWQYNYPWDGQNSTNIGFGVSGIANTSLKWETTTQTDLGVDISLFKGRLTSTIDVYKKVTKDLLMARSLPGYVGVSSVLDNVGSIENKGIEIMIGGDPLTGKFKWNTSFNITINRNKVLDLGPDKRLNVHVSQGSIGLYDDFMFLEVGQPFGQMNGWKFLGLWRSDQDAEARSYGQLPGDPHYADIAGVDAEGNIIQGSDGIVDKYDKVTILNAFPKFTYGWTNQFSYKGFELSALIIGSQGNELLNAERIHRETPMQGNDPILMDYWTPDNQNTVQPAMYDGKYREDQKLVNTYNFGANYGDNSRFVEDASFIRLKTITLAYSFEQRLLKTIGFQMAKVYVSGTNLITITKYSGYDPEVAMYQGSDAGIGVDDGLYPPSKMYSFGINFTF